MGSFGIFWAEGAGEGIGGYATVVFTPNSPASVWQSFWSHLRTAPDADIWSDRGDGSVFDRYFIRTIDDQHGHRQFLWYELQPELLN
jgi:hypothetical protein